MRRRAVLATAGTVALAGCTASGDGDEFDYDAYSLIGLENSSIYNDSGLYNGRRLLVFGHEVMLALEYDPDSEYQPHANEVLLLENYETIAEGEDDSDISTSDPGYISFPFSCELADAGGPYRVVSKDEAGTVIDEFELEVVQA